MYFVLVCVHNALRPLTPARGRHLGLNFSFSRGKGQIPATCSSCIRKHSDRSTGRFPLALGQMSSVRVSVGPSGNKAKEGGPQ